MKKNGMVRKILSLLLVAMLLVLWLPVGALAEGSGDGNDRGDEGDPRGDIDEPPNQTGVVMDFEPLASDVAVQSFKVGEATVEDVVLPGMLEATNEIGPFFIEDVSWSCTDPDTGFDPAAPGIYTFTATLPENYTLAGGVQLPSITVVIRLPIYEMDILSFSLPGMIGTAVIGENTVDVTMLQGTDLSNLVATFTLSQGAEANGVGLTKQISGTTANDFSSPVVYTITAADGQEKNYTVTVNYVPEGLVADFSYAETGINTIEFTDESTISEGTITSWNWNFGDGTSYPLEGPITHTYIAPGIYTVSLTVIANDGKSDTVTKEVLVPGDFVTVEILSPKSGVKLINAADVTIAIKNYGSQTLTNMPVELYVNGVLVGMEEIVSSIGSSTTLQYTFTTTADLSAVQTYEIKVQTAISTPGFTNGQDTKQVTNYGDIPVPAPVAKAHQLFAAEDYSTLEDIDVTVVDWAVLVWYVAEAGGNPLPLTTPLTDGDTYYAGAHSNGVDSVRVPVTVHDGVPAPEADSPQTFEDGATVADIEVTAEEWVDDVRWYSAGNALLDLTDLLVSGETYHAAAVLDGVESTRVPVMVILEEPPTYTVTYEPNGGNGVMYEYPTNYHEGGAHTVMAHDHTDINFAPQTDYVFVSWNTQADGGGTSYTPGATLTMDGNKVLYAIWKRVYTVTLPNEDGYTVKPLAGHDPSGVVAGSEFAFTIEIADGYKGNPFVYINASTNPITPVEGVYTITVNEDSIVRVEGITKKTHTVALPAGEGFTAAALDGQEPPVTVEEGADFGFTITPSEGYGIVAVQANGAAITPDANGVYWIKAIGEDYIVTVEVKQVDTEHPVIGGGAGTMGKGQDYTVTFAGDFSQVIGVRLNGKEMGIVPVNATAANLTMAGYNSIAGGMTASSVKVTLYADFLATLSDGNYQLEVVFADAGVQSSGAATFVLAKDEVVPSPTPSPSGGKKPATGDGSEGIWLYAAIALAVACAGVALGLKKRKAEADR